jgi:hypothetical protein
MNEPFVHGLTLREEGQVELTGRRLNNLARRYVAAPARTVSIRRIAYLSAFSLAHAFAGPPVESSDPSVRPHALGERTDEQTIVRYLFADSSRTRADKSLWLPRKQAVSFAKLFRKATL